ncbi:GNAT family N-acetyltransferase [Nevskia soli]|uniref:GNAT family N-acetyltransferase n=1 Tax=Nevskia soli TaxID=418856 RepID=UPI0015D77704|nr:GNAT family N-acetyltransferase [Nevskia soli]
MDPATIRLAQKPDHIELAKMRASLWPEASFAEHLRELENGPVSSLPFASFVAHFAEGGLIGFVDVGLRSHADGCDPARPVGFIEGWFVDPSFRRRGIGAALIGAAEGWACSQGCIEMASDTWIDHEESELAHLALGFEIVDRCIHFRKKL